MRHWYGVCQFPAGPWEFRTLPFPAAVSPLDLETRSLFPSSVNSQWQGRRGGEDAESLRQSELYCWLLWWGRQGEPPPPPHAHHAEGRAESQLYLINPLAKFSFSRARLPASTSDLPGPCHLSNAHHHSHRAISPPGPQDILFPPLFSLSLPPASRPERACVQVLHLIQGAAGAVCSLLQSPRTVPGP